jgi:hypothetical protein
MTLEEYDDTAAYVVALAEHHRVAYIRTVADEFSDTASRLVGDNLPPRDETERQLLVLYRAGIISDSQANNLIARHLRDLQKKALL